GDDARKVLERALGEARSRRLAARSGVVRALLQQDPPSGLSGALESLLQSQEAADRAAGAFGLAALGEGDVASLLRSRDPAVVRAAARAAFFFRDDAITAAADRLAGERDPTTRAALAIVLAASPLGARGIPSSELRTWTEEGGVLAPLGIMALGPR